MGFRVILFCLTLIGAIELLLLEAASKLLMTCMRDEPNIYAIITILFVKGIKPEILGEWD